ncbi:Hypothetical predicted protein, partial [Scomber scombrus]
MCNVIKGSYDNKLLMQTMVELQLIHNYAAKDKETLELLNQYTEPTRGQTDVMPLFCQRMAVQVKEMTCPGGFKVTFKEVT